MSIDRIQELLDFRMVWRDIKTALVEAIILGLVADDGTGKYMKFI